MGTMEWRPRRAGACRDEGKNKMVPPSISNNGCRHDNDLDGSLDFGFCSAGVSDGGRFFLQPSIASPESGRGFTLEFLHQGLHNTIATRSLNARWAGS